MRQVGMQIGTERRLGTATFESVDPYTGEPWAILPEATRTDVDDAVRAARAAFDGEWTAMTGAEGLHEYLRDKAVWVELTGGTRDPFVLG
jgi:acyl-CoA reductase-like NAD-dependent aldehyde dehydrogenase